VPNTRYNSEIALARERLEKFLHKANAKRRAILAQTPPIVTVVAAVVEASETGPLYRRMKKGQLGTTGGYPADKATQSVLFLLLFDSRTGQLVSDDGVLVLDTPQRGKIGKFGDIFARFISAGDDEGGCKPRNL